MRSLKSRLSQALSDKLIEPRRSPALESKSVHEDRLRDYFDAFEVAPDTGPLDRPICIMLFTNRSGSNAIGEYLRATGRFSGFREALNYRRIVKLSDQHGLGDFAAYLRWISAAEQNAGKIFGMKASADQAVMLYRSGAIPHFFREIHWVLVQRHDVLGQAISFSIAAQTRQWSSDQDTEAVEPAFNFDDIKRRVNTISQSYAELNAFCALFGIEPARVIYEDFLQDPRACSTAVASKLGLESVNFDESKLSMRIQRDERNAEFRERFIEQYRREQSAR